MPWTYRENYGSHIEDVLGAVVSTLNSLTPRQSMTAKTAASDQKNGNARGLVVWHTDRVREPSAIVGRPWLRHTWETDHDYTSMYDALIDSLEGRGILPLSFEQAYYAKISMTNMYHGTATLSLYWISA